MSDNRQHKRTRRQGPASSPSTGVSIASRQAAIHACEAAFAQAQRGIAAAEAAVVQANGKLAQAKAALPAAHDALVAAYRARPRKFQDFVAAHEDVVAEHVGALLATHDLARLMRTAHDLETAGNAAFKPVLRCSPNTLEHGLIEFPAFHSYGMESH